MILFDIILLILEIKININLKFNFKLCSYFQFFFIKSHIVLMLFCDQFNIKNKTTIHKYLLEINFKFSNTVFQVNVYQSEKQKEKGK